MQCSKTLSVISSTDWERTIRAMKLHQYFEFGPSSQDPFSFCQIQFALDTVWLDTSTLWENSHLSWNPCKSGGGFFNSTVKNKKIKTLYERLVSKFTVSSCELHNAILLSLWIWKSLRMGLLMWILQTIAECIFYSIYRLYTVFCVACNVGCAMFIVNAVTRKEGVYSWLRVMFDIEGPLS